MSLPQASQSQINAMNAAAEKMFGKQEDVAPVMNPILQHHEEPVYQESVEIHQDTQPEIVVADAEQSEEEVVSQETHKEMNFRMLRERSERAERERDELLKQMMSFRNQEQPKVEHKIQPEQEEDYLASMGLDEDSLVEGKHFKAYLKKQRDLEKQLQQYKQQSVQDTVEVRLKAQFPDFDSVVSTQNLAALRQANPDLADVILATPDIYKQATLAYKMVKQYGIDTPKPNYDAEKAIAQKNAAKPKPMASVSPQQGSSPMSHANAFANGMTKDLKASLLAEMRAAQKGH